MTRKLELEEAPRTAADAEFEKIMEQYVKAHVPPAVYTRLMTAADGVARAHFGRGFMEGGRAEWSV